MLSTGLLIGIGGGAIAAADTDAATPAGSQADEGSGSTGSATVMTAGADTQPTTEPEADQVDAVGTGSSGAPDSGAQAATSSEPTTDPGTTEDEFAKKLVETSESGQSGSGSGSETTVAPMSTPTPDPTVLAADSNIPAADSNVPAPNSSVATSNSNVVPPVTPRMSPLMTAMQPVANAITTVANVINSVPARIAALPASRTPVIDVITSVQEMLSQVYGAVIPLAQVPSDLYALLGIQRTTAPLIGRGGVARLTVDRAAPLFGPRASQSPVVVLTEKVDGPLFGTMTPPAPSIGAVAKTGLLGQEMAIHEMASLAPQGARPTDNRSLFQHVVSAILVPASLTALAALALPGIAGLLVISAAGIRVGYRQAKAGWAVRVAGIARFAGSGPMGIVRSGGLIALHGRTLRPNRPRTARAACPEASSAPAKRHLERVA